MQGQKKLPKDKPPSKTEGKDGDIRISIRNGEVYLMYKHNTTWYKTKMEKA